MEIHVDHSKPAVWVRIAGSLDRSAAARLGEQLQQLMHGHQENLIIDLSGTLFLSAACTKALLDTMLRLRAQSRRLVLCAAQPNIAAILHLSGLTRIIALVDHPQQVPINIAT